MNDAGDTRPLPRMQSGRQRQTIFVIYQLLHGAPLNAETVGGPGKNTLLPPPLSGPAHCPHLWGAWVIRV